MSSPVVGIAMGSSSDLPTLQPAAEVLERFGVPHELRVLSAHRTPDAMAAYGREAHTRGLKVLIAGAGGAAHLPGMLAANTPLPVIGVPVPTTHLNGLDSLLSVQILATSDPALFEQLENFKEELATTARQQDAELTSPRPS